MGTETVARVVRESIIIKSVCPCSPQPGDYPTVPRTVLLRCKPPRLARALRSRARSVRGSHTHARTHRGTMPTQHDTHLHPSRPAHIASRMHHHSLHGRLPRTPTDPCTHPAAPHTRDAHGHITFIHTLPHSSPKSISELHLRRVAPSRVHLRRSRACKQHTDSAAE